MIASKKGNGFILWKKFFEEQFSWNQRKAEEDIARENKPVGTPMWKLMTDPYIAIIAGALVGKDLSDLIKV